MVKEFCYLFRLLSQGNTKYYFAVFAMGRDIFYFGRRCNIADMKRCPPAYNIAYQCKKNSKRMFTNVVDKMCTLIIFVSYIEFRNKYP